MAKVVRGKRYERAEVTFNPEDALDAEIYKFLMEESVIVGKSSYLKQLIYNEFKKSRE